MATKKQQTKHNKKDSRFSIFGYIILFVLILIIFLLFFKIYDNNLKTKKNTNQIDYNQTYDFQDNNLDYSDIYDENDIADIDKLNDYLEKTNASWRAGSSEFIESLNALPTEQRDAIIYGVSYLPEELTPVDIYGIQLTSDDVLSGKFIDYLDLEDDSEDEINTIDSFAISDDLVSSINPMTGLLSLSPLEEDYDDFDFKKGIGTFGQPCDSSNPMVYDYRYPSLFEYYSYSKKKEIVFRYNCVCLSKDDDYIYGFQICENNKTRSLTYDEFLKYLSEKIEVDKEILFTEVNEYLGNTKDAEKKTKDKEFFKNIPHIRRCMPSKEKILIYNNSMIFLTENLNTEYTKKQIKENDLFENFFYNSLKIDKKKYKSLNFEEREEVLLNLSKKPFDNIYGCLVDPNYPPEYKTIFEIKFNNPAQSQKHCGSCVSFATVSLLESYFYKENLNLKLSEAYLMSQINNLGCSGSTANYYLDNLTINLKNFNKVSDLNTIPELNLNNQLKNLSKHEKLKEKTKRTLSNSLNYLYNLNINSTIPLGVPAISDNPSALTYNPHDACEFSFKEYDNSFFKQIRFAKSKITKKQEEKKITDEYRMACPNDADVGSDITPSLNYKDINYKYFIDDYFILNITKECKERDIEKINQTIKKLLINTKTPLYLPINTPSSLNNYYAGVWSPINKDLYDPKKGFFLLRYLGHATLIYGWGKDEKTDREYWIIRNSWGDNWGENGSFKVWMDLKYENLNNPFNFWDGIVCDTTGGTSRSKILYGVSGSYLKINESTLKSIEKEILKEEKKTKKEYYLENVIKDIKKEDLSSIISESYTEELRIKTEKDEEEPIIINIDTLEFFDIFNFSKNYSKSNESVISNDSEILGHLTNQSCSSNSKISTETLTGYCYNPGTLETGVTSSNHYYDNYFDKMLFSWNDKEIEDYTCDYGNYFCDQDQLRIAMTKKLNILENNKDYIISLGDLKFKPKCINDSCFIEQTPVSYPIKDLKNILTLSSAEFSKTDQKINQTIPRIFQKYLIITTSFKPTEHLSEETIDNYISELTENIYHKYIINNKIYYQFRLIDYLDNRNTFTQDKTDNKIKFLTLLSSDMVLYYGNSLNSFLLVPKKLNSLEAIYDKTSLTTHNIFTSETDSFLVKFPLWKFYLSQTSNIKNISDLSLYEFVFTKISKDIMIAEYSVSKIKSLELKNKELLDLVATPINPSSVNYTTKDNVVPFVFSNVNNDIVSQYQTNLNYIHTYTPTSWKDLKKGELLSISKSSENNFLNILNYNFSFYIKLFFEENEKSKYTFDISYIDQKNKSQILEKNLKSNNNDLFILLNDPLSKGLEINLKCNKLKNECPEVYLTNLPNISVKDIESGYIYTIPNNHYVNYITDMQDIFEGVKEGSICFSSDSQKYTFWYNRENIKYEDHFDLLSTKNNNLDNFLKENPVFVPSDLNPYYFEEIKSDVVPSCYLKNKNICEPNNYLKILSNNLIVTNDKEVTVDLKNFNKNYPLYYIVTDKITDDLLSDIYFDIDNIITKNKEFSVSNSQNLTINNSTLLKNKIQNLSQSTILNLNLETPNTYLLFLQIIPNETNILKTNYLTIKKMQDNSPVELLDYEYNYELCNINKKILCSNNICDFSVFCGDNKYDLNIKDYLSKNLVLFSKNIDTEINNFYENPSCPI